MNADNDRRAMGLNTQSTDVSRRAIGRYLQFSHAGCRAPEIVAHAAIGKATRATLQHIGFLVARPGSALRSGRPIILLQPRQEQPWHT